LIMNEIEQKYYDAYCSLFEKALSPNMALTVLCYANDIDCQIPIGIYVADFLINGKYIIEIDGHEYHKTKEQRYADYVKERYYLRSGYFIIRFMGTEVFINSEKCILDTFEIIEKIETEERNNWFSGYDCGKKALKRIEQIKEMINCEQTTKSNG
jgi:very-short-patch-repair endonuclease